MRSRCKRTAFDRSIVPGSLGFKVSLLAILSVVTAQLSAGAEPSSEIPKALIAQSDDGMSNSVENSGTTSGGSRSRSAGSSERIKKYLGEDEAPGTSPSASGVGNDFGTRRERMRQIYQNMPPEKREKMLQEIKDRRMQGGKRGLSDGAGGGTDGRPLGGADGDGAPITRGPRNDGLPEMGAFRRGGKNFGPPGERGGRGMKGGKLFGREPLDLTVLNLTTEQKNKIQAMRTQDGQKSRQLQGELRQRREKFKDMLFDPTVSSEHILDAHREMAKLQAQTQEIMLNDFLGIRKLLTKEQLELLPQVRPEQARRLPSPKPGKGDGESESKSIYRSTSSMRVDEVFDKANSRRIDLKKSADLPGASVIP
jgi:Spy/CpxP family protein refolding chaperone